ncbi:MAG: Fe-S cluster assembly sulfur transfer protein SufU [bacterium]
MSLDSLYQDIIVDHYQNPRNYGKPDDYDFVVEDDNPSCGDELKIYGKLEDGRLTVIKFTGSGCAISMASASMMSEILQGKTVTEIRQLSALFSEMITGETEIDSEAKEELADLVALRGVVKFPIRVKCATLAW